MQKIKLLFISLLLNCIIANAAIAAKTLNIITSSSIPPYVIVEEDRGIVIDIMRQAFALKGYSLVFEYAPNKRVEKEVIEKRFDGAFNFPPGKIPNEFYSAPIVTYKNVVVSLQSRNFKIKNVKDLANKSIIAFQNSAKFLGKEFAEMIRLNPRFHEVRNQKSQLLMLFNGRADVIVLEQRIFLYFHQQLQDSSNDYVFHPIFQPSPRFAIFIDEKIRDTFNEGLKQLHENGSYEQIISPYIKDISWKGK